MKLRNLLLSLLLLLLINPRITLPDPAQLLSEYDQKRISEEALFAESLNACEMNGQGYYLSFMQAERTKSYTNEQISVMGAFFGAMQGYFQDKVREKSCSPARKQKLKRDLKKRLKKLDEQIKK